MMRARVRFSFLSLIIISTLVLVLLPVEATYRESDTRMDDFDQYTTISINFFGEPVWDGEGNLRLPKISLTSTENIHLGFSDGMLFEEVVDPSPGSPMIPWLATVIEVENDILSIDLEEGPWSVFDVRRSIATIPNAVNHWEEEEPFGTWDGKTVYPKNNVRFGSIGYKHDGGRLLRVYSLWYSPIRLGGDGSSEVSTSNMLHLTLSDEDVTPSRSSADGDPSSIPGTLLVPGRMDIPPEYLIITGSENVDELRPLADWRSRKGLPTSVVEVDHIIGNYSGSNDPADLMREYFKDVLEEWGRLRYVLLAGDWQTVPVKLVKDSDPSDWDDGWIPADSYFQCLDGTWDMDEDGVFGEPGDLEDIIPDITVSRLAIDDGKVWENKVSQIIDYEMGGGLGTWSDRSVLIGANTHSEGDGTQFSNYLWDKYLTSAYGQATMLYEDQGDLSNPAIDSAINEGATFVQFVDHGGPLEWCDDYGAGIVYRARDASSLDNDLRLPFISALACLTTWFDDSSGCPYNNWENCLGEAFTENTEGGAIGYVGSSRVSVGIINTNRYLPYDNGLIEDIARQIGNVRTYVLGDVHTRGKSHYAEVWGAQFGNENNPEVSLCWLEFTLLGEPACDLWTGGTERLICSVEHEEDLDPHITVTVTDENGDPVADANVTIQNFERGIFQMISTGDDGRAVFDIVLDWFCDINLTITKHDHVPFSGFIRISDVIPPETEVVTVPTIPDGRNGWFLAPPLIRLVPNEKGKVHYRVGSEQTRILNSTMNFTLPDLPEGEHNLHFFAEDEAGNLEVERHLTFRIDPTDPDLEVDIDPPLPDGKNGWYTSEPLVTLMTDEDDPGSEIEFICEMDGETMEYSGPFFIPEGEHSLEIRAEDRAGRRSNVSRHRINVDMTPPVTIFQIEPEEPDGENGWYATAPSVRLLPEGPEYGLEYRFTSSMAFKDYEQDIILPDGRYDLEFRSVDPSGNLERAQKVSIKVDTRSPMIDHRITPSVPDGSNGYYRTTPELMFTWMDDQEASIFVSIDGSPWEKWIGSRDIPDGDHRIEAYAVDGAGHSSQTISLDLKVDTVLPETVARINGALNGNWYTSTPTITLDGGEGVLVFYWWSTWTDPVEYGSPFTPLWKEGVFRLYYFSIDDAGNTENEHELLIRIDTEDPIPSLSYSMKDKGRIDLDPSASRDGTSLMYRFLVDGRIVRDWEADPFFSMDLDPGPHQIKLEVRDEAGNIGSVTSDIVVEGSLLGLVPIAFIGFAVLILSAVGLFIWMSRRNSPRSFDEINNWLPRENTTLPRDMIYEAELVEDDR